MAAVRRGMRPRRDDGPRDVGLTLVETVVSMSIGALLLALVAGFTVRQVRTLDYADKRTTAQTQMATTQEAVAQTTRTMVAFPASSLLNFPNGAQVNGPFAASAEVLGFFSYVTTSAQTGTSVPPVQEVWFWVRSSGGKRQLCTQVRPRSRSTTDSGTLATASPDLSLESNRTCRVLVADLAPASSAKPVFQYVTADYDPLNGAPSGNVVVPSPASDSSRLRAVYLDLRVNAGTGTHPVVLEKATLVQLLNKIGRNA